MLTPPRPRNAITENSITPLRPKMSSVPLEGRILKAATLDAELATELENASIHEQAGLQGSYVVFWCQLSALENISQIRARDLKLEEWMPLFLSGYWDPLLIPAALRQPESESTKDTTSNLADNSSGSRTQTWTRRSQSNPPTQSSTTQRQPRATRGQPATTSRSNLKKHSLRQESITRTIPNTSVQETIQATVLPLASSEETNAATWLNWIIASFPAPRELNGSRPKGWTGLHLT